MSGLGSIGPNDPAGYTPFNTNDYLILAAIIGSVCTIMAITVYTYYQSKREESEENNVSIEAMQYQVCAVPESDKFRLSMMM